MEFWNTLRYKDAHLAKLDLPKEITLKLCQWVKNEKNFLFFAGNPGVGKSYFCAAYIHYLQENNQQFRYFTEYNFYRHLREIIGKGWDYEYEINRICETKYVILDDIGTVRAENLSDFQKEAIHIFLDIRYNNKSPTLITSNLFLNEIKEKVSEKVASRLASNDNTIIELKWKDKRTEIEGIENDRNDELLNLYEKHTNQILSEKLEIDTYLKE